MYHKKEVAHQPSEQLMITWKDTQMNEKAVYEKKQIVCCRQFMACRIKIRKENRQNVMRPINLITQEPEGKQEFWLATPETCNDPSGPG